MKKITRKFLGVFLVLTLIVGTITAAFAETGSNSGINVSVETDKDSYEANEKVSITVVVENTNSEDVEDVVVKLTIPDGIELADGMSSTITLGTVKAGEKVTKVVEAQSEKDNTTPDIKDDVIISDEIIDESEKTGDNKIFIIVMLVLAAVVSATVVILIKKKNVKAAGIIATVAVGAIGVLASINMAYAAIEPGKIELSKKIKFDGEEKEIGIKVMWGMKVADVEVTGNYNRVSVHDPSIVKDPETGEYYVFGSHMAWAKSKDLINWTAFTNNINRDYKTIFANEIPWSALGSSSYDVSGNLWAPDVIWNEEMGKWCMYMSVNGDNWYTSVVLLTADKLDGDWTYVGPVVYSGFTNAQEAAKTDYSKAAGEFDAAAVERYNRNINGIHTYGMNAIDAGLIYDEEGNLWMSYGSWFGGIYMLKLDSKTGLRDYTYTYETVAGKSDIYQGLMIAGGNHVSGEASYIEKIDDYYYLFMSYGGLVANGGYNMRVFRSKDVTGPYVDVSGNDARYNATNNTGAGNINGTVGVKIMTYYQWSYAKYGQVAQGHNSAFIDDDGKAYVVYHTRTNDGTEGHTVKVHRLFTTEDGWLVAAPYEYTGESLDKSGYSMDEMTGTYEVLYHKSAINYAGLECVQPQALTLNADGTVSGDYTGTWKADKEKVTLTLGGVEYNGVFVEQYVEDTTHKTLCFTILGDNEICVWGSKYLEGKAAVDLTISSGKVTFPTSTLGNIKFETEGLYNTTVSYDSQNKSVIANDGTVTPAQENTDVVVKATFKNGDYSEVKEFTVTVLGTGSEEGKILVGSYYTNSPLDISSAGKGTYQFPNPFNKSVTEGLEIYNGVSIEFDVKGTGTYLSNIISFLGASENGRLYFTGGSYLGYNATGGYFDANVHNGTAWSAGTDYIKGEAHIEIEILGNTFKVYVNDEVAYTFEQIGTDAVPGGKELSACASVLSWLNNSAETINFGYGSWWSDNFNGTISNVKLYANEIEKIDTANYEYYNDFANGDISEWVSANAQSYLSAANNGDSHGSYALFAPGNQNSRGAQYTFNMANAVTGKYTVEFDVKLKAGNNQTTGFGLTGSDIAYNSNNMNNGPASGYIFYMTSDKSTTWTITNAELDTNTVIIPEGNWVNVKAVVDTTAKTAALTISNHGAVLYSGNVAINGTGALGGIYVLGGRYNSETGVDNVKVTSGAPVEMAEDGFVVLSKYETVSSSETLLDKIQVSSSTGLSVSFNLDEAYTSDWESNVVSYDWNYQQGTMICTYTTDGWKTRTDVYPADGTFTAAGNTLLTSKGIAAHQAFLNTTDRITISYNPDSTIDFYLNGEHIFSYTEQKNAGISAFINGMIDSAANSGLRFKNPVSNVVLGYSIDYSTK